LAIDYWILAIRYFDCRLKYPILNTQFPISNNRGAACSELAIAWRLLAIDYWLLAIRYFDCRLKYPILNTQFPISNNRGAACSEHYLLPLLIIGYWLFDICLPSEISNTEYSISNFQNSHLLLVFSVGY
jgi:hypothetical protein